MKTYSQISPILMKPNRTTNYKLLRKQNGMKNRMRRLRNSLDPILEIVSINGACFYLRRSPASQTRYRKPEEIQYRPLKLL